MALTTVRPEGMGFNTGRRNMVINGAMQVAQRGTSGTIAADGGAAYKSIDRWQLSNALDVTATIAQSTTAPDGFSNSMKITVGGADDVSGAYDSLQVQQYVEAQNAQQLAFGTSSAKSLTLSFWVRSSVTGTYVAHLYQPDGNKLVSGSYTVNTANTWEHKTVTYAGNTSAAIANDNGQGLRVTYYLAAASEYTSGTLPTAWESYTDADAAAGQTANVASSASGEWYITGVQLEVGENASDFEHRSFGEEEMLCRRYHQRFHAATNFGQLCYAHVETTTQHNGFFFFDPPLRSVPESVSISGNTGCITQWGAAVTGVTGVALQGNAKGATQTRVTFTLASALGSPGDVTVFLASNNSDSFIAFDAEL